MFIAVIIP